jgi:hypothetical protein
MAKRGVGLLAIITYADNVVCASCLVGKKSTFTAKDAKDAKEKRGMRRRDTGVRISPVWN